MSVRKELEDIIKRGKSPVYNGVTYTSIESLPSESALSKGDKDKEEAARQSIKAELRRLAEELAVLDDEKEAKTSVPAEDKKSEAPKESKVVEAKTEEKK